MDIDDIAALDIDWFSAGFQDKASFFAKITTPLTILAAALQDSGYTNLTLSSATTSLSVAGGINVAYRTIGPWLIIKGRVAATFPTSTDVVIVDAGGIPSGIRPSQIMYKPVCPPGSTVVTANAYIGTDGSIHLETGSSVPASFDLSNLTMPLG